jgi:hypothetical protein
MDTPGLRGRGLLGRFLYALPVSLLGRRHINAPPVPETLRQAYHRTVLALLQLPSGTDATGKPVPHVLRLAPEGHSALQQFEAWVEPQLAPCGDLGQMTNWAGKLVGAVARLIGILHMVEHADTSAPWERLIRQDSVECAIDLGHYLIQHARAAYAEMGADPVIADAKHILAWIRRTEHRHFTKREAFEGTKGRFKRVEAMEPGLKLLIEHGFIRPWDAGERPGPGRKPSPTYDVHPYTHNSQNS